MTVLKSILTKAAAHYNRNHGVKLAKKAEHGDYNLGAGVYWDADAKEFIVFFVDGGEYLTRADYCTNDRDDMDKTVRTFLSPHKGEPLTYAKPDPLDQLSKDWPSPEDKDGWHPDADALGESSSAVVEVGTHPPLRDEAPIPVRSRPRGYHEHPSPLLKGLLMKSPYVAK